MSEVEDSKAKYALQAQFESLDRRNPSAGNANTTKFQFAQNQHRDLSALFCSHDSMLQTISLSENCCLTRARYEQKQHMFRPIGQEEE